MHGEIVCMHRYLFPRPICWQPAHRGTAPGLVPLLVRMVWFVDSRIERVMVGGGRRRMLIGLQPGTNRVERIISSFLRSDHVLSSPRPIPGSNCRENKTSAR